MSTTITTPPKNQNTEAKKAHPWRRCPIGQHFVREHITHTIPSNQILYDTFFIVQNPKGELHDYLVRIPWSKILDPTSNICMGVRWLFQKKKLASVRLKRTVSWEEAVIEYKSYWDQVNADQIPRGLANFREFYQILKSD